MDSEFLEIGSILKVNREVFLLNYGQELAAFEDLNKKIKSIQALIAKERDNDGNSQVGLLPLLLIIERQAINSFECLTKYQSYEAWMIFRPALEGALVIGKFIDNPANAELWKRKREFWTNNDRDNKRRYKEEFEGAGLIPRSFRWGAELRSLLSRVNDEFMHVNYTYFENMYEIKDVDEKNFYISVSYNDNDILKHKAYLYSFLNAYQLLIICLGEALFLKYQQYPELKNLYKPNVRHTWEKTIAELIATRPDLKEILDSYGLWTIEHPFV